MNTKIKNKGFILIEILTVVAILGILVAIAIPNFMQYRDKKQHEQMYIINTDSKTYIFDNVLTKHIDSESGVLYIKTPRGEHYFNDYSIHIVDTKHPMWNDMIEK